MRGSLIVTFANQASLIDETVVFNLTYGLFVLTTKYHDKDNGCIINTAVQVASDPIRILISVQENNFTREVIEKTGKFNISVLTKSVPFDTIRHFGMQSGRDVNKFDLFTTAKRSTNEIYYITQNTNSMFSCEVKEKLKLGSHTLFVAEVVEAKQLDKESSCTYEYYHKKIKPKF